MKRALIPLVFFAQFSRPLTLKQLRRYGWGREFSADELKQVLKKTDVKRSGDFYFLDEYHVLEYMTRLKRAPKFWQKVKKYAWVFANIPFLKMAAVGNTLAYDNVSDNSDIDLFIVAKKNRVWTARAWLLLWLGLLGIRVCSERKYMKFSPEFFVDEAALDLSQCAIANDYYLAFWLADLVPVWNRGYFDTLWRQNSWLKNQLPVAYKSPNVREEFETKVKSSWFAWMVEQILKGSFGDRIEAWARKRQQKIIEKNRRKLGINPSIITDNRVIKIHFNDKRAEVRDKIEEFLAG